MQSFVVFDVSVRAGDSLDARRSHIGPKVAHRPKAILQNTRHLANSLYGRTNGRANRVVEHTPEPRGPGGVGMEKGVVLGNVVPGRQPGKFGKVFLP